MNEYPISAWQMESGLWVAYGTHNPKKAARALHEWFLEGLLEGVDDLPTAPEIRHEFESTGVQRLWTHVKDEEAPFDTYTSAGPRRVPYMTVYPG